MNPQPAAAFAASHTLRRRWPSVLGLAAAAFFVATGANRETVAIVVLVAAVCYLAAAALDLPWVAWATIGAASGVVVASELFGVAWWVGLGIAAVALVVIGVLGRVSRPALTAQTVALLGYGGLAVTALYLAPRIGAVLVALTLIMHGVWDAIHYRRNQVVPRSLAEFCVFLDVPLGAAVLIVAATGSF